MSRVHPGELTFQGRVLSMIKDIIREEGLPLDGADQEMIIKGGERPDIVIWKNRRAQEAALLLSLKGPWYDAWDAADDAALKAMKWPGGIRFYATWNVNKFFMWDRYKYGDFYDQLSYQSEVANVSGLTLVEIDRVEDAVKSFLKEFLREFSEVYYERKALPPLSTDERFIFRLRSAIDAFSIPAFFKIKDEWSRREEFRLKLRKWFAEQGWTFTGEDEDFEKVARQYVYLLVNKIMFYNILRMRNRELPKIYVSLGVGGEQFREILQSFFNQALKVDYETVFAADFLDAIPLPDDLTGQLRSFLDRVGEYDYSKVGYEVIGRVFERLIPERERHKLGQYYTRSDVVDLIVGFCVRQPDDKVLDPACGAGTFLVRSYMRKKFLNPSKPHEELLQELFGIDIAKFPSHLTTINLVARDLSVAENYPKVLCEDFFDVKTEMRIPILSEEYVKKYLAEGLDLDKMLVEVPLCDAVVMNPPYTRQEEMESLVFPEGYRTMLQRHVAEEWDGFYVGKRSSIYSYFFFHGGKFLREGGRLGLITSNSWLDVDYGKYLQEFFLKHFKIIAIVESKVERWFEDADINTAITILEKCGDKEERDKQLVKFIYLKKPLKEFIPTVEDETERFGAVEKLIQQFEDTNELYEDERLRIFPKLQRELWDEGYGEEEKKYIGSKWGKYLRAPDIFFKILEKGKDILIPLKEVAEVRRGFTTGANDFFYLTEEEIEKRDIEKEFWMYNEDGKWFPNYILKSPRESKGIIINPNNLKYRVLLIHKDKNDLIGTNVLRYIQEGETKTFGKGRKAGIPAFKPTCASRQRWYEIGKVDYPIVWRSTYNTSFAAFLNTQRIAIDKVLYGILPKDSKMIKTICALLNSSLMPIFTEMFGTVQLGQGALFIAVYETEKLLIPNPAKLKEETMRRLENALVKLSQRPIGSVFEELGAKSPEGISLNKIKKDRSELDKIIFDILDLSEVERLEVYKTIVDLVKSRIERAKSVRKRKKKVKGIDVEALVNDVLREVGEDRLISFPDAYVEDFDYREITVPKGEVEVGQDLYGFYVKIDGKEIRCESPYEARYIQYAVLNGKTTVKIFTDERLIQEAVKEYGAIIRRAKKRINEYLESTMPDRKLRKRVKDEVWRRLTGQK